jgi:hypothetical protein
MPRVAVMARKDLVSLASVIALHHSFNNHLFLFTMSQCFTSNPSSKIVVSPAALQNKGATEKDLEWAGRKGGPPSPPFYTPLLPPTL